MAFTPDRPRLVPFYVGQTSDLRRRLREHARGHTLTGVLPRHLSAYAALARVDHAGLRLAIERALIAQERPAGNHLLPSDRPVFTVNAPSTSLF